MGEIRTKILGIGSHVPDRVITNDELRFLDQKLVRQPEPTIDTSDEWIVERTGVHERRYVVPGNHSWCSDLAARACEKAIEDAGADKSEVDCIILGTLSPDIHFPGTAVFTQKKLGINPGCCACFDIRQQCSAFVYGLQMADAFIRTGTYRRVLLVGSEVQSSGLEFATRGRDVTVIFGDGAGAFLLGPAEGDQGGILYSKVHADGSGAWDLYLKCFTIDEGPLVKYDPADPESNLDMFPQMNGRKVFVHAVKRMAEVSLEALARLGMTWDDVDWFVPHQANLRINQAVAGAARIPPEKVLNTIEFYGNTTAATIPLTLDHYYRQGRVKRGDTIMATVFGAGFTWGTAVFRM